MINKKGVSPVIATVLLIFVTIAGVGIIAGVLIPFIKTGLTSSTSCLEYRDYFKFSTEFSYNCYRPLTDRTENAVSVRTKASSMLAENIKGFELVFLKTGASKKIRLENGTIISQIAGLRQLDNSDKIAIPLPGEMISYIYDTPENYKSAEIYPVLESGKICDKSDEVILNLCPSEAEF